MNRIILDYPDDCPVQVAVQYLTGCFNPSQLDYRAVQPGYQHGTGLTFGDGRNGYFYRTANGNYVLRMEERKEG